MTQGKVKTLENEKFKKRFILFLNNEIDNPQPQF